LTFVANVVQDDHVKAPVILPKFMLNTSQMLESDSLAKRYSISVILVGNSPSNFW